MQRNQITQDCMCGWRKHVNMQVKVVCFDSTVKHEIIETCVRCFSRCKKRDSVCWEDNSCQNCLLSTRLLDANVHVDLLNVLTWPQSAFSLLFFNSKTVLWLQCLFMNLSLDLDWSQVNEQPSKVSACLNGTFVWFSDNNQTVTSLGAKTGWMTY